MSAAEFHWRVPERHPALAGHFPGRPIVPGVVLLDRAVLYAEALDGRPAGRWQIAQAKFFRPVGPGEQLTFALQAGAGGSLAFSVRSAAGPVAAGSLSPAAA